MNKRCQITPQIHFHSIILTKTETRKQTDYINICFSWTQKRAKDLFIRETRNSYDKKIDTSSKRLLEI